MGLLIDSTLLIHAERNRLTPARLIAEILERWGDVELAISAMSAGELLHGCWRADSPARRARREEFVEAVLGAIPVVCRGDEVVTGNTRHFDKIPGLTVHQEL